MQAYIRTEVVLADPATVHGVQGFYVTNVYSKRTFVSLEIFVLHYRPIEARELTILKSTEAELGVARISDTNHPCTDNQGRHNWHADLATRMWFCVDCGAETDKNPRR